MSKKKKDNPAAKPELSAIDGAFPKEHKYKSQIFKIRPNVLNTSDAVLDLADELDELEWAAMLPIEATNIYAEYRWKLTEIEDMLSDNLRSSKSMDSTNDPGFKKEYKSNIDRTNKAISEAEKQLRSGKYASTIALIANKKANVLLKFQNNPDNMKRLFAAMIDGDISSIVYDVFDPDYIRLRGWVCNFFYILRLGIHRPIMIV